MNELPACKALLEAGVSAPAGADALRAVLIARYDLREIRVVTPPLDSVAIMVPGRGGGAKVPTPALAKIEISLVEVGGTYPLREPPRETACDERLAWQLRSEGDCSDNESEA
jgi:hypothetical protein